MLRDNPETATGVGRHEYDDRWPDASKQTRERRRQFFETSLTKPAGFPPANLSPHNHLTQRLIQYDFKSRLDSRDLEEHLLSVGQMTGFHNIVFVLTDRVPARTVHDYENIVARLRAIPAYVDQQSKIVTDLTIQQICAQMSQTAEQSALLAGFRAFPAKISPADRQRLNRRRWTHTESISSGVAQAPRLYD